MHRPIFITGGAGFIGSSVVREALNRGYELVVLDCLTYAGNLASLREVESSPNFRFREINICDREDLNSLFREYRPGGVIHLAAESHVDRSIDGPDDFIQTNIDGTFQLLEASRLYFESLSDNEKEGFRFHHVSTDEVFGDLGEEGEFFEEDSPYNPSSPYAASKAASDHLVRAWGRTFQLPILVSNCSNNYGPRQFPEKLIPHMILNALAGKSLPVYGDGNQIRDWLYVEDHASALLTVYANGDLGETYNIGGKNKKRNLEVVHSVCDLLDELSSGQKPAGLSSFRELITFVEDRPGHDFCYAINPSKIESAFDWAPRETFESGIRKTVEWYLANQDWWQPILDRSYRPGRPGSN